MELEGGHQGAEAPGFQEAEALQRASGLVAGCQTPVAEEGCPAAVLVVVPKLAAAAAGAGSEELHEVALHEALALAEAYWEPC